MVCRGKTWNEIGEYDTNIVSVEGLEIQAQYCGTLLRTSLWMNLPVHPTAGSISRNLRSIS